MRLPTLAISVITGISPLLWLPQLPSVAATGAMALLAIIFCLRKGVVSVAGWVLLFFCWGVFSAHQVVLPANTLPGKVLQAEVLITATDGDQKHVGVLRRIGERRQFPAPGIVFYGQTLPDTPCAGQTWRMTLSTHAVHGQLNDGLFDAQRQAISQHLPLTGRFTSARLIDGSCGLRGRIVASLAKRLEGYHWYQVMLALAVGERAAVPADVKMLLQQTGTSHLLAISGLHVSLVAMLGWWLIRGGQRLLPCRWIGWKAPLVGGFIVAAAYAWLSGLQPPAQRTLIAAGCWLLLRMSGRHWNSWDVWLCCVAGILVLDPPAVLSQSLWLSAFAVAALLFWYQWGPARVRHRYAVVNAVLALVHLQVGLMLLLLPLQLAVFHGFSWTSLIANIVAVPLVTLVELPLLLAGLLLHYLGPGFAEQAVWFLADKTLEGLFVFLAHLPKGWAGLDSRWQWAALFPWLGIAAWRLGWWRASPVLLIISGVLASNPFWRHPPREGWSVTMLDVGQGLSMVIARNGKALLYDTGLAWPGGDSGQQIIVPWLRWHHLQPEGIILSHEHLDHRGGMPTLLQTWPGLWVRSPLGWKGHQPCFRGEDWHWQGLTFRALWPLPGSKETGNNRSCVVRVDDGRYSVLLTGDIETPAEMLMLSHYWQHLASTLVQVPHHGSSTSSSGPLLQRIEGRAALASAARYNAWHLPSEKVRSRYQHREYRWLDTPHQGQITVNFSAEGWQIQSLRDQIFPRWYHQWFGDTRDNG